MSDVVPIARSPLDELSESHDNAVAALQQHRIVSIACNSVLTKFPSRLPSELVGGIAELAAELRKQLETAEASQNGLAETPEQRSIDIRITAPSLHPLAEPFLWLSIARLPTPMQVLGADFTQTILRQELVSILALLEAFLGDALRTICRLRPEVLRRSKKLEWKDIMECGSWDGVLSRLEEELAHEHSMHSISARIELLKTDYGLSLHLPPETITVIDLVEQIRHVILHNGSRTSREFLRRTQSEGDKVGEELMLDDELVAGFCRIARSTISAVLLSVIFKHGGHRADLVTKHRWVQERSHRPDDGEE